MNYRRLIVILAILVAAVAVMIFSFSTESREESSKTSDQVVEWLLQRFYPGYNELRNKQKRILRHQYQEPVRKAAHGLEFMLLGTFLFLFLHGIELRRSGLWAWVGGTLYAATDELHQTLVSGRGGMVTDVCIDSGGVLAGIFLGLALLALFHRIFGRKPRKT
ncbi:MAG: VanZ family protein [Clostridia bacterium]|nr:VanZ family protein [Clostridia bacterium]